MTLLASFLILLYCIGHSYWNFLVKKSSNPQATLILIAIGSWMIPFPIAIYFIYSDFPTLEAWIYIAINGVLQIFYYALLGRAYKLADLSVVYPLARGSAVFFIPLWGIFVFQEKISIIAFCGILLVFLGLIMISLIPLVSNYNRISKNFIKGIFLSVLVGLNISIYTIFDKKAVDLVSPFIYPILITVGGSLGALFFAGSENKLKDIKNVFFQNKKTIITGSLVMYLAYSVMLYALMISKMSYVGTSRELTIIFGLIWSYFLLKEGITKLRFFAIITIFIGAISISLS